MELLKRDLQKRRQILETDFGGRKLIKLSEIEQKKIQRLREEEQRELRSKALRRRTQSPSPQLPCKNPSGDGRTATSTAAAGADADADADAGLDLPREEVVRRLRILKQPTTLFGEDDTARLRRLKEILESGPLEIDSVDMTEGQTNDFLRDIYELRKRHRAGGVLPGEKRNGGDVSGGDAAASDREGGGDGRSSGAEADKDTKLMKANFEELFEEDKILVFFRRLLSEWSQELEEMPEAERRTAKGKSMFATCKQCARYLNPLFKMCRKRTLPDEIRRALLVVVECCMKRDYLAAMDQYIKLAIGNAPWPIGVTMVGIHERSAREKIYTNCVAHIMNDETTRKYLQSVKRLMTFCQQRYPADPSRSVEFNSLANGSDLQSLLAEERAIKNSASEERPRLITAA